MLRPPKADVDVTQVQAAFPVVEGFGAVAYMDDPAVQGGDPACEYFEYARGAFTSNPADEFCMVLNFEEAGEPLWGPAPVAFDDQARADLKAMLAAFASKGAPLRYLNVVLTQDGSMGPDSNFAFDRCVSYRYQPGWIVLPEDTPGEEVSTGIDPDWYRTDNCP